MRDQERELYDRLKNHCEKFARRRLAEKLLHRLPVENGQELVPLIGSPNCTNNTQALQVWIREVIDYAPVYSYELTLDHWHERLVCDLLTRIHQREDHHA